MKQCCVCKRLAAFMCSQCLDNTYCSEACAEYDWKHHFTYCRYPVGDDSSPLEGLFRRVQERLGAELTNVSLKENIDEWISKREALAQADAQLQRELDAYVTTKEDVEQRLEMVVILTNLTSMGPIVMRSAIAGYGLFADRRYKGSLESSGAYITTYGGAKVDANAKGPYVLHISAKTVLDGFYGFQLIDKGRWINHDNDVVNVYFLRDQVRVFTPEWEYEKAPWIEKGTELIINYGDEYAKFWEEEEPPERKKQKPGTGAADDPIVL